MRQAWACSQKQRAIHDSIRSSHFSDDTQGFRPILAQLHKGWLAKQIAAKQHAVADAVTVELLGKFGAAEGSVGTHRDLETEPGTVGAAAAGIPGEAALGIPGRCMGGQGELEHFLMGRKTPAQDLPVVLAGLDELRQPAQLNPTDGGLGLQRLEVEPQVAVGVLVVVAGGQFAQLPAETLVAGVLHTTGTPAVPAPVAEALGDHLQLLVAHDVHGAAFPHRQVMGWIEALGAQVAPGAGPAHHPIRPFIQPRTVLLESQALGQLARHRVAAAEGVTVVLHQPQTVPAAEREGGAQVERIPKGMGHHHRLGLPRPVGRLQLLAACIAGDWVGVDEDRHRSDLNDRRHGVGEDRRHGDHLVARKQTTLVGQLLRSECRDRHEIGGGARIHQQAVLHSHESGQLPLHRRPLRSEREPEIEGGGHGRLHFVLSEHTPGVGDGGSILPLRSSGSEPGRKAACTSRE